MPNFIETMQRFSREGLKVRQNYIRIDNICMDMDYREPYKSINEPSRAE